MKTIKVVTDDGNAYYDIVSRLKKTHLRFSSVSGQTVNLAHDLVITSKMESSAFEGGAVAIEDLDKDPVVMEGQLLSLLVDEPRRELLVGVDPGSRIGVAVFYGGSQVGSLTMNSVEESVDFVANVVRKVPHISATVKVGGGEPKASLRFASALRVRLPRSASIEIVDESGTSARKRGVVGATKDQMAAARIAFRKGPNFNDVRPLKKSPV